ncbi:MAG TPA: sigma-70 family RNA polymerase sigma factor [Solirubrobacteraceae bacterium]
MTMVRPRTSTSASASLEPELADDLELFRRWHEHGDHRAREILVRRHLPLSRRLAARYRRAGQAPEDLRQVAALGLLRAIDRFRPELGHQFSSFAVPTVLGELRRHLRDTGWAVHVPRRAQEMTLAVERTRRRLRSAQDREPGIPEIAQALSVPLEDVLQAMETAASHYAVSLEAPGAPAGEDASPALAETLGEVDHRLHDVDVRLSWAQAVGRLPPRERQVLTLRVNRGMSQREIAEQLGCSRSQVGRLLEHSTAQLKDLLRAA